MNREEEAYSYNTVGRKGEINNLNKQPMHTGDLNVIFLCINISINVKSKGLCYYPFDYINCQHCFCFTKFTVASLF